MSTVKWTNHSGKTTLSHIESGLGTTLCGLNIPYHRPHEWNAFGRAECKRCLAVEASRKAESDE